MDGARSISAFHLHAVEEGQDTITSVEWSRTSISDGPVHAMHHINIADPSCP